MIMLVRPLLYVAAPVRTATDAERALVRGVRLLAFDFGWCPVWGPALLSDLGLTEEVDREQILECDSSALSRCDSIVVVGSRVTEGMEVELRWWLSRRPFTPIYLAHELAPPRLRADALPVVDEPGPLGRGSPWAGAGGLEGALARIKTELAAIGGEPCPK